MGNGDWPYPATGRVLHYTGPAEGWTLDLRENGRETQTEQSAVIYAGTAFRLAELKLEARSRWHTFAVMHD